MSIVVVSGSAVGGAVVASRSAHTVSNSTAASVRVFSLITCVPSTDPMQHGDHDRDAHPLCANAVHERASFQHIVAWSHAITIVGHVTARRVEDLGR